MRSEEIKQGNYEREHRILETQENLSKKISEIREKELSLSRWETELVKKANEIRQELHSPIKNERNYIQSQEELHQSREMSLRSFGRPPHPSHKGQ